MKIKMTKKMPKKEGLYLYCETGNKSDLDLVEVVEDCENKGEYWVYDYPHARTSQPLDFDGYWFGPIEISQEYS